MKTQKEISEIIEEARPFAFTLSKGLDAIAQGDRDSIKHVKHTLKVMKQTGYSPKCVEFYSHAFKSALTVYGLDYEPKGLRYTKQK